MKKAEEREPVICPLAEQLVLISLSFESTFKSNTTIWKTRHTADDTDSIYLS